MYRLLNSTLPLPTASFFFFLIGTLVLAQGKLPGGAANARAADPGRDGALMLVLGEQIQKELQMTEDQIGEVWKLEEEWVTGFGDLRELLALPPEEREKRLADKRMKDAEIDEKVKQLLRVEQSSRLRQIRLWMGGVAALVRDEETARDVNLSDVQLNKLKTIMDEFSKKNLELRRELPKAKREDRAKIGQQISALPNDAEVACRAVLTDEQMARFEALRGPKFEIDNSAKLRDRQKSRDRGRARKRDEDKKGELNAGQGVGHANGLEPQR